jgi:dienelactone hydrolase
MSVAGKQYHLEYDPAAAPDAEARTKAFFNELLR